jgi:hypothetical protein
MAVSSFPPDAHLAAESHFAAQIRACPRCRQSYLFVFLEHVDWVSGDDPQYWTIVPLTDEETAEFKRLPTRDIFYACNALPRDRMTVNRDWPKGAPIRTHWGQGLFLVM